MPGLCVNETDWSLFRTHIIVTKTKSKNAFLNVNLTARYCAARAFGSKLCMELVNGCTLPLLKSDEIVK